MKCLRLFSLNVILLAISGCSMENPEDLMGFLSSIMTGTLNPRCRHCGCRALDCAQIGGPPVKLELFEQSAAFLLFSVFLAMLLGVAVRFEMSRLVVAIAFAGACLLAELYVIVKILHRLWRWSGAITGVLFRNQSENKLIDRSEVRHG